MALASDFSILAVDDTDIILELLQAQLQNEGYHVTTANNGARAKQLVQEVLFDLILLDIEMPEIDGIELLQFIKGTGINTESPVIMLTARNDSENVKTCLGMGAKDYILKPFNTVSVKQRIWKMLQK